MLTSLQKKIVKLLAPYKSEESYFAGSSTLNTKLLRFSNDMDIFHDEYEQCILHFKSDIEILEKNGLYIIQKRNMQNGDIGEVDVFHGNEKTTIQWATDSAFRFFPLVQDPIFGFKLHHVDAATNKILALAGRGDVIRDYYDVCNMIFEKEPVVAYIWAACGKDPGYSPHTLLEWMSRHTKFQEESLLLIQAEKKFSLHECKEIFMTMADEAREKFSYAPCNEIGTLYLKFSDRSVFFPSLSDFEEGNFVRHRGSIRGSMPQFVDIPDAISRNSLKF
ncbi:MAG: hypothetical protein LBU06_06410 [Desulfovibrio sp.]|jgi:hypothetical protein|nr:hypothetical protein [Desulfovibrio sp.]